MDINIDALYNILKQNQGDVNDAMGFKKKPIVVTYDPFALIAKKTKVSKSKEKVVFSSDSKGSSSDDFSELKKITALLAKAFNRRNFYSKPTNNNLRTSSSSQSANKKQEFVKTGDKKDDEKKRDISRISEVSYYLSESESESEYENSEYYDGLSGYFQIPIDPEDQEKTTFTCPYGTFAYRRMPFGLCNAPGTFQRCMMAIFHDMIKETMKVFMDDFLKQEEKRIEEEQAASARYWKIPACCDDDDDYDSVITPVLSTEETKNSLSMGDEHLDTIPATKLDEVIKSSVEDLVSIPSESEGKNGCDVPSCFTTFSNILFDADYDFESVDDQSLHNEDVSEKIFSNPLFEKEIISIRIDQHHFNAESDLRLLYDNSSPRPPEESNSENSNAEIESFSASPIPNED
nr:reverse transcriptase domain-containing protein [Tanacetum cinerariifolium]